MEASLPFSDISQTMPATSLMIESPGTMNETITPPISQFLPVESSVTAAEEATLSSAKVDGDVSEDDFVRLLFSFDMGYTTRDDGHTYDSLNSYAAAVGSQSRLVLDYTTRNRKRNLCDRGHPQNDHDCRLNFKGSAKAMDADAAVKLSMKSKIFNENKVEVGVFTSDNDSSSIHAIRKRLDRPIRKQSDRNHTTEGVKNLYKTANTKGITGLTNEAIQYLHRSFTYAIAQNDGNADKMAIAIRSISQHAYDNHRYCGELCGY